MSAYTNKSAKELIENYVFQTNSGEFALMLSGSWGVGKTHFINKILEDTRFEQKAVYVSLNGIASEKEVYDQIMVQLSPLWHSDKSKKARKIFGGLVSAALRYDVFNDEGKGVSFKLNLDSLELNSSTEQCRKARTIIFDDLERVDMTLRRAMGMINGFVEHAQAKVIIISDEDKLTGRCEQYRTIKEKVVGITAPLQPDFDSAISNFIAAEENKKAAGFYRSSIDLIKDIFTSSKSNNLRHIRFALMEFTRLANTLEWDEEFEKYDDLITRIFRIHLIFQIEVKKGYLSSDKDFAYQMKLPDSEDAEECKLSKVDEQYSYRLYEGTLFELDLWKNFALHGLINSDCMQEAWLSLKEGKQIRSWLALWKWDYLSEERFNEVKMDFFSDIANSNYTSLHEIPHYLALLLFFEREGVALNSWNHQEIRKKITSSTQRYLIQNPNQSLTTGFSESDFDGYCYYEADNIDFIDAQRELGETLKTFQKSNLMQAREAVIESVDKGQKEHHRALTDFFALTLKTGFQEVCTFIKPPVLVKKWAEVLNTDFNLSNAIKVLSNGISGYQTHSSWNQYFHELKNALETELSSISTSSIAKLKIQRAIRVIGYYYPSGKSERGEAK